MGNPGGAIARQEISGGASGSNDIPAILITSSSNSATAEQAGVADSVTTVGNSGNSETDTNSLGQLDIDFFASGDEEGLAALQGETATFQYAGQSTVPQASGLSSSQVTTSLEIVNAKI